MYTNLSDFNTYPLGDVNMNCRPVDELTRYPDMKQTRKALSYTAKQLIANEVQLEKQRLLDRKSRYDKKPLKIREVY